VACRLAAAPMEQAMAWLREQGVVVEELSHVE